MNKRINDSSLKDLRISFSNIYIYHQENDIIN